MTPPFPFADLALSQRLERAEAAGCRGFVEARARVESAVGAVWREFAGTFAMFDGPSSPITQTFNLGMERPVDAAQLDEIEAFYHDRQAPVFHEVSPLADDSARHLLVERGYRVVEYTSVLYRPIDPAIVLSGARNPRLRVRAMVPADIDAWVETAVSGWSEFPEYAPMMRGLSVVNTQHTDARCYLATLDDAMVATGGLSFHGDVALCAGASTIPAARQQGAQLALLEHRLRDAAAAGHTLAMMCARPGSGSQRNAERHGFRVAYTRVKWGLLPSSEG
ncbi:MAG: hypothetical protein IPK85_06110 [Gemmatimonadetes bacterium]|nr:hypothetical protein [Gemmatimonadota bacterium]